MDSPSQIAGPGYPDRLWRTKSGRNSGIGSTAASHPPASHGLGRRNLELAPLDGAAADPRRWPSHRSASLQTQDLAADSCGSGRWRFCRRRQLIPRRNQVRNHRP